MRYGAGVNFFGHATVASWQGANPGLTLGAMLPDFATMCRARIAHVHSDDIAAGVALHHRTDAAFHQLDIFVELCADTTQRLRQHGVAKGGARASAHVAVEMFLDGALLDDEAASTGYLAAIELAPSCDEAILWQAPDQAMRWDHLCKRLGETGLPRAYRDPIQVAERITWILARRPRLALADDEAEILRDELGKTQNQVLAATESLLAALSAVL